MNYNRLADKVNSNLSNSNLLHRSGVWVGSDTGFTFPYVMQIKPNISREQESFHQVYALCDQNECGKVVGPDEKLDLDGRGFRIGSKTSLSSWGWL